MPRSPAPLWRMRKEPVLDELVMESIRQAGGHGHFDPETGWYATLVYRGCATRERAMEIRQALFRAAGYLHKHGAASVSMAAKVIKDGDEFAVEFRAVDKDKARQYILSKHGPDISKWPYDPRARGRG